MKEENVHCDNKIYYFHKKIFKIYYLVKNMYFMRFISFAYKVSGTLDTSSAFASFSFCCHSNVLMPINMFHPSWASFKEAEGKWAQDLDLENGRASNPTNYRAGNRRWQCVGWKGSGTGWPTNEWMTFNGGDSMKTHYVPFNLYINSNMSSIKLHICIQKCVTVVNAMYIYGGDMIISFCRRLVDCVLIV